VHPLDLLVEEEGGHDDEGNAPDDADGRGDAAASSTADRTTRRADYSEVSVNKIKNLNINLNKHIILKHIKFKHKRIIILLRLR
jgi:hypothetical protein